MSLPANRAQAALPKTRTYAPCRARFFSMAVQLMWVRRTSPNESQPLVNIHGCRKPTWAGRWVPDPAGGGNIAQRVLMGKDIDGCGTNYVSFDPTPFQDPYETVYKLRIAVCARDAVESEYARCR